MKGTMAGAVIKSRKGLILDFQDEKKIEAEFPGLLSEAQVGLRSFLSVPLISGDQAIGTLHLASREYKAYSERDLRLAENIAHQITGAIANAQLFDDLNNTAKALRQKEILLRNVLDLLPVGVGIADKNGKITSINLAREQIWGGAKIVGIEQYREFKGWWRDTGKKIEAEEWPLARAVLKGEISLEKEIDIECFDGARKTVRNWAVPIRDTNQGIVGAVAVNQDITERKQAEERLRRSEEHFRSLIENSSDMIFEVDKMGTISYVSPSAERILGFKAGSLIGKNAFEFIHPDDLTRMRETYGHLYQNPAITKTLEYRVRHSDGSWRIFQSVRKLISEDGRDPMVIVNSRDITEQKNLEGQLGQAQKLEAVGQLAAGIAHEINTPTQYVGDNTRFLQDAFKDLNNLLEKYGEIPEAVKEKRELQGLIKEVEGIAGKIDLPYLTAEIPKAIQQTLEGVERVTKIVRAMKEFSHPGTKEKTLADINKAVENTITVSRNEWNLN